MKYVKLRANDTRQENSQSPIKEIDTKIPRHGDLKEAWGRSILWTKSYIALTVLFMISNRSKIHYFFLIVYICVKRIFQRKENISFSFKSIHSFKIFPLIRSRKFTKHKNASYYTIYSVRIFTTSANTSKKTFLLNYFWSLSLTLKNTR